MPTPTGLPTTGDRVLKKSTLPNGDGPEFTGVVVERSKGGVNSQWDLTVDWDEYEDLHETQPAYRGTLRDAASLFRDGFLVILPTTPPD